MSTQGVGYILLYFNLRARWGRWSRPRPGRYSPRKSQVPIVKEAGWTPGASLEGCGEYTTHRDSIPEPPSQ